MIGEDRSRIDAGFAAHKREQARQALAMSMAERLDWLDRALDEFVELWGLASRPTLQAPAIADDLTLDRLTATSPEHAAIATNIGIALMGVFERSGRVYGSDLQVRVTVTGFTGRPDVTVIRGPLARAPASRTTALNPTVIVEVLDDADIASKAKAEHYRQIPSLRACLLVSHGRQHIEVWRRDGEWTQTEYGAGDMIELRAIGVTFAVDQVYRGVHLSKR